jgi:tRNA(Ile)-lysidine synthase
MASSRKRRSSDLVESVAAQLARHVPRGARLTLGLSGGVDSIAALDILARLAPAHPFALDCLHVNHRISPHAGAWARFARAAARAYGLRCSVRTVDLAPYRRLGVEGAARAARYAAFTRAGGDFLVLAQHRDDQAETVLLQLVRGAGVAGLAGMAAARPAGGPTLLRPLLGAARAEIEQYARDRGLKWVEDESNADERYARNLVRRRVMPLLGRLNPAAAANLARSAAHLAEAHELARALAVLDAHETMRDGRLSAAALARLLPARARNLLRWTIAEAGLRAPDAARLDEVLRQLVSARVDAGVRIALDGAVVMRYRDAIWLVPAQAAPPAGFRARWDGRRAWHLPELGGTLRFKPATGVGMAARALSGRPVEVRLRAGGERFQPDGRRPRRMLKTLLQESGIPPWERERMPLLYCAGKLVAVPGIGVAAGAAAAPGERAWTVSWAPDRPKLPKPAKAMIK